MLLSCQGTAGFGQLLASVLLCDAASCTLQLPLCCLPTSANLLSTRASSVLLGSVCSSPSSRSAFLSFGIPAPCLPCSVPPALQAQVCAVPAVLDHITGLGAANLPHPPPPPVLQNSCCPLQLAALAAGAAQLWGTQEMREQEVSFCHAASSTCSLPSALLPALWAVFHRHPDGS